MARARATGGCLTGVTRIADTLPRQQLLDLLNAYADCLVGVVHDHDGEVMKFMGDGILAAFDGARGDACGRALDAAEAATAMMVRLNQERSTAGLPVTRFTSPCTRAKSCMATSAAGTGSI